MATAIPANQARFTIEELLAATGGEAVVRGAAVCVGVCTDSRAVVPGHLFVALVGARFDGHDHVAAAIERGASAVLVSRVDDGLSSALRASEGQGRGVRAGTCTVVRVADTTAALGDLGRAHRRRWAAARNGRARVVAITGSAGKTTTRRATEALLRGLGLAVHATTGNLNNAVGIPMVLLGLRDEHEVLVAEVGTSSRGEIARGAELVEPDVAVLTLVAAAHTEAIGTVDDVAREKGALFEGLVPHGDTLASPVAIACVDSAHAAAQRVRARGARWLGYGLDEGADVRVTARAAVGLEGARLTLALGPRAAAMGGLPEGGSLEVLTPLLGAAGALATAAAVSAAVALGALGGLVAQGARLDELGERVTRALAPLAEAGEGEGGRLAAVRLAGGSVLIDDSYNANRASTVAGLGAAAEIARAEGRRLLAVLGEMRELGVMSVDEHRQVGRAAGAAGVAALVAVAGDAAHVADAARAAGVGDAAFVLDARAAVAAAMARLQPGDVVLVKGSRGVGLELVAKAIAAAGEVNDGGGASAEEQPVA